MRVVGMLDPEQLRERATRLLAMALKAREDGHADYAERLTERASHLLDEATAMENHHTPKPEGSVGQPAQQQQQPQPKTDKKD
jgi:hypothetical protein